MLLSSIPSPPESVWMLGPLPLRAYALFIIAGIIIAAVWGERRYQAAGGPKDAVSDIAVWMVLFGILGARIYHVITTPEPYFGDGGDPWKVFRVWEGGLGIWGAIALGAVGAWIGCRRRGLRFGPFADAMAPGIILAQAIGRMGNYFNQELFGKPTDLPWALEIDPENIPDGFDPGTTFHPTFLYEMLWCIAGCVVLVWAHKRFNLRGGQLMALYVMIYTSGRVWIEYLRIDTAQYVLGFRLNVWTSLIVFAFAAAVFAWLTKRLKTTPEIANIYLSKPSVQDD